MAGPRLRRKFRVVLVAEGDTWEDAGEAATHAIMVLQKGNPAELPADGKPFEAGASNAPDTHGWRVEISKDDRMTHEAYVDLKQKAAVTFEDLVGVPEGDAGEVK